MQINKDNIIKTVKEMGETVKDRLSSLKQSKNSLNSSGLKLNLIEYEKILAILIELPGVAKEDISLSIKGDKITIETKQSVLDSLCSNLPDKLGNYYIKEIKPIPNPAIIELPSKVKDDDISTKFDSGLLLIILPKAEKKEISIS